MENRIYYGEYTLKHWIEMMLRKEIVLPKYQRYYTWNEEKVETLINTFEKKEFVPPVTIGAYKEHNAGVQNLIIDGQQRLTSILLAYLGIYPDRKTYASIRESYAYDENEEADDTSMGSEPVEELPLEWQYTVLVNNGFSKKEILRKINENEYNKLKIKKQTKGKDEAQDKDIKINDKFLEDHYMGFCYIVPKTSNIEDQTKYYSSVFRHINIQGEPLSPLESRQALYFLRKDMEKFFAPDFCSHYSMSSSKKMDFVRYLSLLSQYHHGKEKTVAYRYMRRLEQYYEEYIYSIINETDTKLFGKYSDGAAIDFEPQMKRLKEYADEVIPPEVSKSIIDMDIFFMGLIYMVLFEKKKLNEDCFEELSEEIQIAIDEFKKDNIHKLRPNTIGRINMRLEKSIEIYEKYIAEE